MKELIKFQCEICKEVYDEKEDALKCEKTPIQKIGVSIGDKIIPHPKYYLSGRTLIVHEITVTSPGHFENFWADLWDGSGGHVFFTSEDFRKVE